MTIPSHEDIAREVNAEWDTLCTSKGNQRDDNRKRKEARAFKKSARVFDQLIQSSKITEETSEEHATNQVCGFLPAWLFVELGKAIITFFVQRALRRYFARRTQEPQEQSSARSTASCCS